MNKEDIALIVIALLIFAGVFYAARYFRPFESSVNGLRVIGENPRAALAIALSPEKIVIQENLINASDRRNSAVGAMGAEIAHALRGFNKTIEVYGVIEGIPSINCNSQTSNCTGAQVIVRTGPCNCLDTRNNTMVVEGSADFLLENLVNMRGITKLVLTEGG